MKLCRTGICGPMDPRKFSNHQTWNRILNTKLSTRRSLNPWYLKVSSFWKQLSLPNATSLSLFLSLNVFFSIYKTSAKTVLRSTHEPYQWSTSQSAELAALMVSRSLDLVIAYRVLFFSVSDVYFNDYCNGSFKKWLNTRNNLCSHHMIIVDKTDGF